MKTTFDSAAFAIPTLDDTPTTVPGTSTEAKPEAQGKGFDSTTHFTRGTTSNQPVTCEKNVQTKSKTNPLDDLVAFETNELALRAAIAAQRAVMALRAENPFAHLLGMRIGLFAGPATLVCQDGRLDYFGQTVATCARLLAEAHSGDILLPASLIELLSANAGVKAGPIFSIGGKGLPASVAVTRLAVEQMVEQPV